MTRGTSKFTKIIWIIVTLYTLRPFCFMRSAIDREIHTIMIESGWCPTGLCMTRCAVCRKLRNLVIWRFCFIIIHLMTAYTSIRRIIIISLVTCFTILCNLNMSAFQFIKLIVYVKLSWCPIRCCSMTLNTIIGQSQSLMIWIDRFIKIFLMTVHTNRTCSFVHFGMTFCTIDRCMCSCQWECCSIVIERHTGITRRMTG